MRIGDRRISHDDPPYIIAEIGVNHDGSVDRALDMVDQAGAAGADAVKLQLFQTDRLLSKAAKLAAYQKRSGAEDPFAMLRGLEMSAAEMAPIVNRAHERNLHAIVSIFSVELVEQAQRLPFDAYKTASTDIINRPLIEAMIGTGKPLFVSTGAATLAEVAEAVSWMDGRDYVLLHCVSSYPTPDDEAALNGRTAMLHVSPNALGYSDHTASIDTGALAVAGGARVLEKHFTYDRSATGPDHAASLDQIGLAEYIRLAHRAFRMCGAIEKNASGIEDDVRRASRQSVTAVRSLPAGHLLQRSDITIKRPGTGISPARLEEVIGRKLARAVEGDMPLVEEDLT